MANVSRNVQRMVLGDVEVIRIVEWHEPFVPAAEMFPDVAAGVWRDNERWLAPDHWEPRSGRAVIALQTWVLRSGGRTVLIDTGAGNGRERPGMAPFHRCEGDFLGLLDRAGVRPRDVDVVVNTHLHVDHVGWNTTGADGDWVPTFPRAQYLVPAADDFHYGPDNPDPRGLQEVDRLIYADSVAPVHRAGQVVLWDGSHRIDDHLTLEAAPGHTPGHSVLRLASGNDRAVFAGDLLHSPVQILDPSCSSNACLDPGRAAASRRRVLARAAEERELLVPAHFGGSGVVEVRRNGDAFALGSWAALDSAPTPVSG
ncbi:MBL fold metallo-hydrolase [Saccharopolyspora gloriosae]|uniref:Glyoxylase-like metal-dependent hydrolase (Beta-lactamase superfamily II) n=1 Tax=Saccharopolyspora gloriosae TaxID=455344 RepID=A0A840NKC6_9PSEU|nr:MBL fold metallo-hydrolase [Saccharopolyspora gloriosae]MBB5070758.1 glyoxylase-like metal-dependent hydrolase (beta-lactamase superfamily II) [Saccharopolyspora gloriosae]